MESSHINTCLVLVIGIPGSGKTTLIRSLVEHFRARAHLHWTPLTVHCDDYFPPDLRAQDKGGEREHFVLKAARRKVMVCIEQYIVESKLGTCIKVDYTDEASSASSASMNPPDRPSSTEVSGLQEWRTFTDSVRSQLSGGQSAADKESLSVEPHSKAIVLLLDDNMHLRSMRYEYYQLARKYGLGFAQVCVCCSTHVAKERNLHRPNPIPDSTIELMELSMEYPDSDQNHWEKLSVCISSEGDISELTREGCHKVLPLVKEALSNPVQPLPQVDPELQESCQLANIDSYIHQADKVLRRCVSWQLELHSSGGPLSKEDKAKIARGANQVRRQLLDELRHGVMNGSRLDSSVVGPAQGDQFRDLVKTNFTKLFASHLELL